ncbi:unnamed protein product [Effrenium voratum]|nr:unnamed protein product [Effrenium voratum]
MAVMAASDTLSPAAAKPLRDDRLSVLAHCARGGTISYGIPRKPAPQVRQEKLPPSEPESPLLAPALPPPEVTGDADFLEEGDELGAIEEPPPAKVMKPAYLGQYFGNCVARLDGSSERPPMGGKLQAGEPRAKSYAPVKTLGEGVAPCYTHLPKWSFGGGKNVVQGKSRSETLQNLPKSHSSASLASLKRPKGRSLARGFGSSGRSSLKLSDTPGPAAYNLHRLGDEVPVWASQARLPWGTRTGGRSKLLNATASDVGPGEYTAEHQLKTAAPSAKIGQKLQEAPDSRKDYPAAGHYPLGNTIGNAKPYKQGANPGTMGAGQRSKHQPTCSPGFMYDPRVEPTTHAQTWSQGERKSWLDADPDEPPGPGAYNIKDLSTDKRGGWSKDEKQFRKMEGMGPVDGPGPNEYSVPFERLGWGVKFRGRLAPPKEELKPAAADYYPIMDLVTHCTGVPKPLHRTTERRSIFDVSAGGHEGVAEALLKRALKSLEENGQGAAEPQKLSNKYESTTPSWSMPARRSEKVREASCDNMYGPWSSID